MFSLMASWKPSDKFVTDLDGNRIFLVDPDPSRSDAKTYRELLRDLESASKCVGSNLTQSFPEQHENFCGSLYDYLVCLLASILNNQSITLDHIAPSKSHIEASDAKETTVDLQSSDDESLAPDLFISIQHLRKRILQSTSRITLYTSGTTGTPKPIRQSVANLARSVQISSKHDQDVWGLAYQPTKIAALQVLLQAICNGNTIVNLFDRPIAQAREFVRTWSISHLSATPTYFRLLAAESTPFPTVRAVTVGGEVCDGALRSKLESLFPNAKFRNVYASSEMGTLLHSSNDCFVVTDSLRNSILVREGRLWIHQSLIADNLHDQCEDGFWDSGDEVQIVDENPLRVKITGRRTDWINVGGTKVNPHDVEKVLRDMPGVVDARVFGVVNSVTGQIVAAELSKERGVELDLATIRRELQRMLPSTAVPRLMTVRDTVTSTETLKKERHS
jgi:acyl-CoA synthetase (AMP-forming)/AMP-acid ligase II